MNLPIHPACPIRSMTGFGAWDALVRGQKYRIEIKALNHRFLDLKTRLPREWAGSEIALRAALQAKFSRGSIEVKVERLSDSEPTQSSYAPNLALATQYYECLLSLQRTLGLSDAIRTIEVAGLPDVIVKKSLSFGAEEAWTLLEPHAQEAMNRLNQMREHEGHALAAVLASHVGAMIQTVAGFRSMRQNFEDRAKKKFDDKIRDIFKAYPIAETSVQSILETRIAQELAIVLDRSDIDEEITRFSGHVDHFLKTLNEGGPVGRKLEFILQEMGREVNTLGNKAQDLGLSESVVGMKVKLEQLREQVLNLE